MVLEINDSTIQKLGHEIIEIRRRTLLTIDSKITKALRQNEEIYFNEHLLIKLLIQWFDLGKSGDEIPEIERVLRLIWSVLKSKYGETAIAVLGVHKLLEDVLRIEKLLDNNADSGRIIECGQILSRLKEFLKVKDYHIIASVVNNNINDKNHGNSRSNKPQMENIDLDSLNLDDHFSMDDDKFDSRFHINYVECWETPSASDINSLKLLKSSLRFDSEEANIQHALHFLTGAIEDYPAEYFLQPPFIFLSLKNLIDTKNFQNKEEIIERFIYLTRGFCKRIKMRQLSKTYLWEKQRKTIDGKLDEKPKNQISVGKYFFDLFVSVLDYFKECVDTGKQKEINQCFQLMMELIELTQCDSGKSDLIHFIDIILRDLAYLIKYFRNICTKKTINTNETYRNHYLVLLYIICRLLSIRFTGSGEGINNITANTSIKYSKIKKYDPKQFASSFNGINEIIPTEITNDKNKIVLDELKIAIYDLPLEYAQNNLHKLITKTLVNYGVKLDDLNLSILFDAKQMLSDGIKMIKQSINMRSVNNDDDDNDGNGNVDDESMLYQGLLAMDTLSIHNNVDVVNMLFQIIIKCMPFFDGNLKLKKCGEEILLRLLAHENKNIKRQIYRLCGEKVKFFFSILMDGQTIIQRHIYSKKNINFLGIPFTSDILIEMICFGCTSDDQFIEDNAKQMLTLLLKSCRILPQEYWQNILEILMPTLSLIQCYADKSTPFGLAILNFFDPDNSKYCPRFNQLKGNICLLYNYDRIVRDEAIARVLYILLLNNDDGNDEEYLPNINNITDTIPSSICLINNVSTPFDPQKNHIHGIYQKSAIYPLIQLLNVSNNGNDVYNSDPSVRKTTLIQLNIMAQDPELLNVVYEQNGLMLAIKALKNSLLENHRNDYPDAAIPAIGIIMKICCHYPQARRELSQQFNIYCLLLRAMCLFYQHHAFQVDISVLLFLLSFSDYSLGSDQFTIPNILRIKRIQIPFKYTNHWLVSPFNKKSSLEELYNGISVGVDDNGNENSEIIERYIRLIWANLWFNGFDQILANVNNNNNNEESVNYNKLVGTTNTTIIFDEKLQLNKSDICLLRATNTPLIIRQWIKKITNATNHNDLELSISGLMSHTILSSSKIVVAAAAAAGRPSNLINNYPCKEFLMAVRRYCSIALPNNQQDEQIFEYLLKLFESLVDCGVYEIHIWLLEELCRSSKNCVYLMVLSSQLSSTRLYLLTCKFLANILRRAIYSNDNQIINLLTESMIMPSNRQPEEQINLCKYLCEMIVNLLDEKFEKRELDKLRALLQLLRTITGNSNYINFNGDDEYVSYISNKLLHFVAAIKSLAQVGSKFNKDCMLIIGNLMNQTKNHIQIKVKYLKLLSGLCGHNDLEIRAIAWDILLKLSNTLQGASELIKEFAYLPGGFHACCLSSFLDQHDASIVRESAGCLFANLIKYRDNSGKNVLKSVAPICGVNESVPSSSSKFDAENNNNVYLIIEILMLQKFFTHLTESIYKFWPYEIVESTSSITNCDLIRTYCQILRNLIDLQSNIVDDLYENGNLFELIRLIPCVQLTVIPSVSTMLMIMEICNLIVTCSKHSNLNIFHQIGVQEHAVIDTLLYSLDLTLYLSDNDGVHVTYTKSIVCKICTSIFSVLIPLVKTDHGNRLLCQLLITDDGNNDEPHLVRFLRALTFGLQCKQEKDLNDTALTLLKTLLIVSDRVDIADEDNDVNDVNDDNNNDDDDDENSCKENREDSFISIIDSTKVHGQEKQKHLTNLRINKKDNVPDKMASELLFEQLIILFERLKNQSQIQQIELTATVIGLLLKCSLRVRRFATDKQFTIDICKELNEIIKNFGMPCSDFIRRFSESKKEPILAEIRMYLNILLNWFSVDCLQNTGQAQEICKILINLWPWSGKNQQLQIIFFKTIMFLCEDSLPVCKTMASYQPGTIGSGFSTQSLLQYCTEFLINETGRPKHPQAELIIIQMLLRILSNCSSCIEGRLLLMKLNIFDCMNRLHPTITKYQRPWPTITMLWLRFYEIFTRYIDGNISGIKHLSLLCTFILKSSSTPGFRLPSLLILRNMAFNPNNKAAIITSDEYLYVLKFIIENGTIEEQIIVGTIVWRLAANNYKAKHVIRNSSILSKLSALSVQSKRSNGTNDADADCPQQNYKYQKQELIYTLEMIDLIFSK